MLDLPESTVVSGLRYVVMKIMNIDNHNVRQYLYEVFILICMVQEICGITKVNTGVMHLKSHF